jgi:hypothetical protein
VQSLLDLDVGGPTDDLRPSMRRINMQVATANAAAELAGLTVQL